MRAVSFLGATLLTGAAAVAGAAGVTDAAAEMEAGGAGLSWMVGLGAKGGGLGAEIPWGGKGLGADGSGAIGFGADGGTVGWPANPLGELIRTVSFLGVGLCCGGFPGRLLSAIKNNYSPMSLGLW